MIGPCELRQTCYAAIATGINASGVPIDAAGNALDTGTLPVTKIELPCFFTRRERTRRRADGTEIALAGDVIFAADNDDNADELAVLDLLYESHTLTKDTVLEIDGNTYIIQELEAPRHMAEGKTHVRALLSAGVL